MGGIDLQGVLFGSQNAGMFGCGGSSTVSAQKDAVGQDGGGREAHGDGTSLPDIYEVPDGYGSLYDKDNDGFIDIAYKGQYCIENKPGIEISKKLCDCNDNIASINPGAQESCNEIDDNCNGITDEGCIVPEDVKEGIVEDVKGDVPFLDAYDVPEGKPSEVCEDVPDLLQDTKGEIPFLDVYEVPEITEVCKEEEGQGEYLSGWKYFLSPSQEYPGPPIITDVNNDGKQEVVINYIGAGTNKSTIGVFKHDGEWLPGWPKTLDYPPPGICGIDYARYSMAVGDLTGDGTKEILIWDMKENEDIAWILAFNFDGSAVTGWPVKVPYDENKCNNKNWHYISLADLNGDGNLEVVSHSDQELYLFNADGTLVTGWPKLINEGDSGAYPRVVLGNLDKIPGDEIIQYDWEAKILHAWKFDGSEAEGFPVLSLPSECGFGSPSAVADVDKDGFLEVIISDKFASGKGFTILHYDGLVKSCWKVANAQCSYDLGAISDLNNDQLLELVIYDRCFSNSQLYAYHYDGTLLPGWPVKVDGLGGLYMSIVKFADDGAKKIISAGDGNDKIILYNSDGSMFSNTAFYIPFFFPGALHYALGDLDQDKKIELIASARVPYSGEAVQTWEFDSCTGISGIEWGMWGHDARKTWNNETPIE